jgi:6-pyruvoyltetrahydropterin/6-carboxytetrahydropterin synthase
MNQVRITKLFHFEMAHALYGYDGPCKNIHGHSYELSVTVKGAVSRQVGAKQGMVMDFSDLKKIVTPIIGQLDHATLLNKNTPHKKAGVNELFQKLVLVDYQPTCENMLVDIAGKIAKSLPGNVMLHHLKLKETPTSYAEWHAEDNKALL